MAEEVMEDRWDPFLDAYAQVRDATIAYDALCDDMIEMLSKTNAKTKHEQYAKRLEEIRKEYNG